MKNFPHNRLFIYYVILFCPLLDPPTVGSDMTHCKNRFVFIWCHTLVVGTKLVARSWHQSISAKILIHFLKNKHFCSSKIDKDGAIYWYKSLFLFRSAVTILCKQINNCGSIHLQNGLSLAKVSQQRWEKYFSICYPGIII